MSEHRRFLRRIADADPYSLVGRYETVDDLDAALRVRHEVRRALRAGRRLRVVS